MPVALALLQLSLLVRAAAKPSEARIGVRCVKPIARALVGACLLLSALAGHTQTAAMQVTLGSFHACALSSSGGVKCWGGNSYGQLGDGSTSKRLAPVDVVGLASGVSVVAAGRDHTCAVVNGGAAKCWGYNQFGQLGDGTYISHLTPMVVSGLSSGVSGIAASDTHNCALLSGGTVKCWGLGDSGQLGNGNNNNSPTPVTVNGLSGPAIVVAVGGDRSCALISGGTVMCWGGGSPTPATVTGFTSTAIAIAAAATHHCALLSGGAVMCWGYNSVGQLGDGSNISSTTPVPVSGLSSGVTAISAEAAHTCALRNNGGMVCWGDNYLGKLGDGTQTNRNVPVDVIGLTSGVMAMSAGYASSCAVLIGGGIKCWGDNAYGQFGDAGKLTDRWTPVNAVGLKNGAIKVSAGNYHSCAVNGAGGVQCWGSNYSGALGDGTNTSRLTPVDVVGLNSGIVAVAAGSSHSCALNNAGGMLCWGDNYYGKLGDGSNITRLTPVPVSGLSSGVMAIATGGVHSCALLNGGAMKCWGNNGSGELGIGSTTGSTTPVTVSGLSSGVLAIATGSFHTCALLSGGAVKCWGDNYYGQLGDGTSRTTRLAPVPVSGIASGAIAISAGESHTCALLSGGAAKCWGLNDFGQLGDGSTTDKLTPVPVSGLSVGATAIAAGYTRTCAISSGGRASCWGDNAFGQLGDGTATQRLLPTDVSGLVCGVLGISGSGLHTCAVTAGGEGKCWGRNDIGEVGDGTITHRFFPSQYVIGYAPPSTTVLSTSAISSAFGERVTFKATVSGFNPAGTVNFKDGGTTIAGCAAIALDSGRALCASNALTAGPHAITALYSGDGNNIPSASSVLSQVVTSNSIPSACSIAQSPNSAVNPVAPGTNVLLTMNCSGGSPVTSCAWDDIISTSCSRFAAPTATTTYAAFPGNASGASPKVNTTVFTTAGTSTPVLSSSTNPSVYGQSVTYGVTVNGSAPTDKVTFKNGAVTLCSDVPLSGGTAQCVAGPQTLTAGTHAIGVIHRDAGNNEIGTGTLSQVVNKANASLAIGLMPNPPATMLNNLTTLSSVTVTVSLSPVLPGTAVPGSGTIAVGHGGAQCLIDLAIGSSCTLAPNSAVPTTVTANYAGDNNFLSQSSAQSLTFAAVTQSGPLVTPTGVGSGTIAINGAASCTLTAAAFVDPVPLFPQNDGGAFALAYAFQQGVAKFRIGDCGSSPVSITITYPEAVNNRNAVYYKYGPAGWYVMPGAVVDPVTLNQVRFTLTDNQKGDDDANLGIISDPGGLALRDGTSTGSLDIDGDGSVDALTDGLLSLRHLFGLSGAALTAGALGPNATITNPATIKAYLDRIRPALDFDGNGQVDALTDGLMLIRYLSGLRGPALTAGAIGAGAIRTTPADVESCIQTTTP